MRKIKFQEDVVPENTTEAQLIQTTKKEKPNISPHEAVFSFFRREPEGWNTSDDNGLYIRPIYG